MCELIHQHLDVQVYSFRFSRIHVVGVLSAIKSELEDRLRPLDRTDPSVDGAECNSNEDVLELRPNLYGVGLNLRALWRRWKGR